MFTIDLLHNLKNRYERTSLMEAKMIRETIINDEDQEFLRLNGVKSFHITCSIRPSASLFSPLFTPPSSVCAF